MSSGIVNHVKTEQEYNTLLTSNKKLVVDFSAKWCGPCKQIAPYFEELAKQYQSVIFVHVDIDSFPNLTSALNIRGVPTFNFVYNQKVVATFSGANKNTLKTNLDAINKLE